MKEIEIEYDTYYDRWQEAIEEELKNRDMMYYKELPLTICKSLKTTIDRQLKEWGYKPKDKITYRQGFVTKLRREGLKLQIRSNRILWKYLEYFTDIEDYSKCFDIEIVIEDFEKASKDMIFVKVVNNKNNFNLDVDINKDNNKSIEDSLESIKGYKNKYPFMSDLINILENLAERS